MTKEMKCVERAGVLAMLENAMLLLCDVEREFLTFVFMETTLCY
jgi:hypothetical protein